MLKIFGKHGTNEKSLVPCPKESVRDVMIFLNKTYGGNWVFIDSIRIGEGMLFTDQTVYKGFDGGDRYTDAIIKIPSGMELKIMTAQYDRKNDTDNPGQFDLPVPLM